MGFVNRFYKPNTKKMILQNRKNYMANMRRRYMSITDPDALVAQNELHPNKRPRQL